MARRLFGILVCSALLCVASCDRSGDVAAGRGALNEFPDLGISGNGDAQIFGVCVPCNVGHCPSDPSVFGVCPPLGDCLLFGPELCNGHDDDCNGLVDDTAPQAGAGHGDAICDDGIFCTFDKCVPPVIFENVLVPAHCKSEPRDTLCDDSASCTTDVCDPSGTATAEQGERINPADTHGCRFHLRDSWCTNTWDGCGCNGKETCDPLLPGALDASGCHLQPQWIITGSTPHACDPHAPNWPCADTTHPCDNCKEQLCCEASTSRCDRTHLDAAERLPEVEAYCEAHRDDFTHELVPTCIGPDVGAHVYTCPSDGDACTIESCNTVLNQCIQTNRMPGATTEHDEPILTFVGGRPPPFSGTAVSIHRCTHEVRGTGGCTTQVCVGVAGLVGPTNPASLCTPVVHTHSDSCHTTFDGCVEHGCSPFGFCEDFTDVSLCPQLVPGPYIDPVHRLDGCFGETCLFSDDPVPLGSFAASGGAAAAGCYFVPSDSRCPDDGISCTQASCALSPTSPDGPPIPDGPTGCWNIPVNVACGAGVVEDDLPDGGFLCRSYVCSPSGPPSDPLAIPLAATGCYLDHTRIDACVH